MPDSFNFIQRWSLLDQTSVVNARQRQSDVGVACGFLVLGHKCSPVGRLFFELSKDGQPCQRHAMAAMQPVCPSSRHWLPN